ncbi:hypothetical protein FRC02_004382 [Tulasnella sp. 418]|nr:hypothetical protein FRC02_004382 [Tulasnella sp. 418]
MNVSGTTIAQLRLLSGTENPKLAAKRQFFQLDQAWWVAASRLPHYCGVNFPLQPREIRTCNIATSSWLWRVHRFDELSEVGRTWLTSSFRREKVPQSDKAVFEHE